MACSLDMFNKEHNNNNNNNNNNNGRYNNASSLSPRISFSNDFIDSQISHERSSQQQPPPVSSDFEFSVTNYNMMAADELFSKGRLLPFKDNGNANRLQKMTLREELLLGEDSEGTGGRGVSSSSSARPPKGSSSRWKELLGLKRSHIVSKKVDKTSDGSMGKVVHEEPHVSDNSQLRDGGSSCKDWEIGM